MKIKKIPGSIKFLLVMVLLYLITAIFSKEFVRIISIDFIKSLISIIPVLVFAYIVMFLINLFVNPKKINKHLGHESGIKGWIYSIIGGILLPGAPYIIFPILGDLKKHGMKNSLLACFLYSKHLSIAFIPIMAYYFGVKFTIVLCSYIFIFSIVSGIIMGKLNID